MTMNSVLFVRWLGVVGLGALASLPACSETVQESLGGDGGNGGGETTTSSAGNGGNGGGAATTTASEGGGAPTTCSPACDEHATCIEGQCAPIRIASISAWRIEYEGFAGFPDALGGVQVCEAPSVTPVSLPILAQEGECLALVPMLPPDDAPAGLKLVTAAAPSFGTLTLAPSGSCQDAAVNLTPEYLDGETVTFEAAAGDHNPAFAIEAPSPPPLTITPGPFTPGQPLEVTWEADGKLPVVLVVGMKVDVQLLCTPTQGTSLVISGALTDLLPPSTWSVVGILDGEENTLDVSPTYTAKASTRRIEFVALE